MASAEPSAARVARTSYPTVAKVFHWVTVVAVAFMLATGLVMTARGEAGIWDGLTNWLYSSHKLIGFCILWFTIARLAGRLVGGVPPHVPPLPMAQRVVAEGVHAALYGLLIVLPILGWLAVSLFPARTVFDWFQLPALTAPDKVLYESVAEWHATAAYVLMAVAGLHIGAALFHLVVKRDGVFARMWPGR